MMLQERRREDSDAHVKQGCPKELVVECKQNVAADIDGRPGRVQQV